MKLSVLMITYNQKAYIGEAIDSVLAQRTDFPFELVVGEDCSTDATRSIVRAYEAAHPGKVRGLYPEENLGMCENLIRTYRACRGEYLAVLEGDDYWIDPQKLQKQVDFLDQHPDCAVCCHNVYERKGGPDLDAMTLLCSAHQKPISDFADLLAENFIGTCSVMYRRLPEATFPEGLHRLRLCDWPLHLMHAQRGRIGYLPEPMAVYRVNPGGVWSQMDCDRRMDAILDMYAVLDKYFEGRYSTLIHYLRSFWDQQKYIAFLKGHASRLEEAVKILALQVEHKDKAIADLQARLQQETARLQQETASLQQETAHLRQETAHLAAQAARAQRQVDELHGRRSVRLALQLARMKNLPRRAARALRRLASTWNPS